MSTVTYFFEECPTCGRALRVKVNYLGKKVVCEHCQGEFIACDRGNPRYSPDDRAPSLLDRATQLLEELDSRGPMFAQ